MLRTQITKGHVTLPALIGLALLSSVGASQVESRGMHAGDGFALPESGRWQDLHVLTGQVLGPDRAPAEGAVVVTSAGGRAVTGVDGSYEIEFDLPLGADSVQVTAVAPSGDGGSLVASARASLVPGGWTLLDPLALAATTSCQPSWLPTFGGKPGTTGSIYALAVFDDGSGPALYAGGSFSVSPAGDSYLEKWGCSPAFATFCTAKTALLCGAASIGASGTPSATATSGFVIAAQPVSGCRVGLLLYSNQPIQPGTSFGGPGNGLLCMPGQGLRRAGPIESGGNQQSCDGVMSIDMNAFNALTWTTNGCNPTVSQTSPAGFLSSIGITVNAQVWGQDSIATGQVLSDGISWCIGP